MTIHELENKLARTDTRTALANIILVMYREGKSLTLDKEWGVDTLEDVGFILGPIVDDLIQDN